MLVHWSSSQIFCSIAKTDKWLETLIDSVLALACTLVIIFLTSALVSPRNKIRSLHGKKTKLHPKPCWIFNMDCTDSKLIETLPSFQNSTSRKWLPESTFHDVNLKISFLSLFPIFISIFMKSASIEIGVHRYLLKSNYNNLKTVMHAPGSIYFCFRKTYSTDVTLCPYAARISLFVEADN